MNRLDKEKLRKKISETIQADIQCGKVGGVAVAVTQDGNTVYEECFSDSKNGVFVTDKTLFRLASMTKPITAIAILILVTKGKLELDMPVSKFLPGFSHGNIGCVKDGAIQITRVSKTPLTIRHLLNHSGGLGSGPVGNYIRAHMSNTEFQTLEQTVKHYENIPLDFEPGTAECYSSLFAFDVLARIVEVISGKPYDVFLKQEVFEPLDMKDTTFAPDEEQQKRMIPMHAYENGVGVVQDFPEGSLFEGIPYSRLCAGAGLCSTLSDYKKFAGMLLNGGNVSGYPLVKEELIREMSRPQVPKAPMREEESWGLSVRVVTSPTYQDLPCGAYGWSGAYGTHFWIDPVNRITAVYMKNSRYDGGGESKTARQLEKDVHSSF